MEPIVRVENISKKYILDHQQKERYVALRDVIMSKAKSLFSSRKESEQQLQEEFWALKDISFEINQGDRLGIIGRNGAGKSTLLKILSRITDPTSGRITIDGRIASLLEVGTGFHPELTGRENIFLNGSILGMNKREIESKFDEIVAFAEIEKFLDTPVKRYSSGMYVRLAFAVAAHLNPEILIVDEVLAVGDMAFQKKCLGKMEEVSGQGRTILFVSHNMQAVQKLCNKGILLQNGKLIAQGNINSVMQKYLDTNQSDQSVFSIALPSDFNEINGYATKLQVENMDGVPVNEIPIGKPWQVRVFFKINRSTPGFVIALGVSTMFDMPVQTTWTTPQDLQAGEYSVVFKNTDVVYTEGQYKLIVGLSSEKRVIQYVEGAGMINISDVSSVADDDRIINTKSGLLINQMNTQISKIS